MTSRIAALLTAFSTACTSLQAVPGPIPSAVRAQGVEELGLTLRSGVTVRLRDCQVVGDSVIGTRTMWPEQRAAFALADVDTVKALRPDRGGIALTAVAVGGMVVLYIASAVRTHAGSSITYNGRW
ncbi:MAG: hypothetical protein HY275_16010 [Gemmatimonadetes bacterium]|nr:hypothetical protein [Gemmatimonadota bacterium]